MSDDTDLAVVQSKGRDINKPGDLWIVAGFCDDRFRRRSGQRESQDRYASLARAGYGHIIRERYRWILNHAGRCSRPS